MNILNYFKSIKDRINNINSYITNPFEHKQNNTEYYCPLIQTYIWFEKEDDKTN